jgi:hypothetical protein
MPFKNISDNPSNVKTNDRILILRPIGGKATNTKGSVDNRLFTGGNKLHAIMDEQHCHWSFKYDSGQLPGALQNQVFTSFSKLMAYVTEYYKRRNVEIVEVKDLPNEP